MQSELTARTNSTFSSFISTISMYSTLAAYRTTIRMSTPLLSCFLGAQQSGIMKDIIKRRLLILLGTISTSLGIIGIFIPILPTTPFLLLAAACYARSSERVHRWLLTNRLLGAYITNYIQHNSMTLKSKVFTITLLWVTIGFSLWFLIL